MKAFRLIAGLAGIASALPLLFIGLEGGEADAFLVVLVTIQAAPFALLIALADRLSMVARSLGLAASAVFVAVAYLPLINPDPLDGQAGIVFIFLPFYLTALVLLVWLVDALVRAVSRRVSR